LKSSVWEQNVERDDLVAYLDDYLQVKTISDISNNGLQVEGARELTRLAFAVDASLAAFVKAQASGAQMLIVHHGLFWGEPLLVTGLHYRRLGQLFKSGLSLYAAHLPLDFHEEVGNYVTLARWLDLKAMAGFGDYHGYPAGVTGLLPSAVPLDRFIAQVESTLGEPVVKVWPFGSEPVQLVGISSGGGGFLIDQAAEAGVDVYLTGEMSHRFYHRARELGINVVYGGHYATETAGLKALAEHLAARFGLDTVFLDLPTGA
jgi:dinuclear metal center YbgI/SA1388 family protein